MVILIRKLWGSLSERRKKQFWVLAVLMVVASFMEMISIGLVFPFLAVLADPEILYSHGMMQYFIEAFGISSPEQLFFPVTLVFVGGAFFAGMTRLLLLFFITRLSYACGTDLSSDIYRRSLYQEYSVQVSRNSSEIINSIVTKTNGVVGGVLTPVLTFFSSIILLIGIVGVLLYINAKVAALLFVGFGCGYWFVSRYTRRSLKVNGERIAKYSTLAVKSLQEGLGGIRDVIVDGNQEAYSRLYCKFDYLYRYSIGNNLFIAGAPRYVMEALGMVLIASVAYTLTVQHDGVVSAIPVLGAIALGAQRLLPVLQQIYGSYSNIMGARSSLEDVISLVEQPLPSYADSELMPRMIFDQEIKLVDVDFRYANNLPIVLDKISISFCKGDRIGIIGETGCGKSTLLDIVMGLLAPTRGQFIVDGVVINGAHDRRAWQQNIAHVPQNIFLSDASIEENIAFGVEKECIDHDKLVSAAKRAKIHDLINGWSDGYETVVGERGVRLSGGQRQRIGIARALYKSSEVLIFDEATSALDSKTEAAVMSEIESMDERLTIFIIAHRISTLKGCNKIIKVDESGRVISGVYQDFVGG